MDLGLRALDLLAEMSRLVPTSIIRDAFEEASKAEANPRTWSACREQVTSWRILLGRRVRLLATAAATTARESLKAARSPCASRLQRWWRRTRRLRNVHAVLDTRAAVEAGRVHAAPAEGRRHAPVPEEPTRAALGGGMHGLGGAAALPVPESNDELDQSDAQGQQHQRRSSGGRPLMGGGCPAWMDPYWATIGQPWSDDEGF